jgi:hypothetical protein
MPFQIAPPAVAPAKVAAPPPPTGAEGSGTMAIDETASVDIGGPDVPEGLPRLNVEQYAWIAAVLKKTSAGDLASTLTRLRLTPASRTQLEAIWKAHMARHPELKLAYIQAYAGHIARLGG